MASMLSFIEELDEMSIEAVKVKKNGKQAALQLVSLQIQKCLEMISKGIAAPSLRRTINRKLELYRLELEELTKCAPEPTVTQPISAQRSVNFDDSVVTPSFDLSMSDLVGMRSAKLALTETIMLPNILLQQFKEDMRYSGVLLFGPTGTGKSSLVRAAVNDCCKNLQMVTLTFFNINIGTLLGSGHGDTEKNLTSLFNEAAAKQPAVLLVDEMDSLMTKRSDGEHEGTRKIKNHLLSLMDGLGSTSKVIIIGTTNKGEEIDVGFLRRFDKRVYVPLPTTEERKMLLHRFLSKVESDPTLDLDDFAARTHNFSPANLQSLVKAAYHNAFWKSTSDGMLTQIESNQRVDLSNFRVSVSRMIRQEDMIAAIRQSTSTINYADLSKMEAFAKAYGTDYVAAVVEPYEPYCTNTNFWAHPWKITKLCLTDCFLSVVCEGGGV